MKIRNTMMWAVGALVAAVGMSPVVSRAADAAPAAAPAPVAVSLDLPVLSAYVWRGQVLNDQAVVEPSMTISKDGFTINYWGNFNLTDHGGDTATGEATSDAEFSEYDLTLSYNFTCPITGAGLSFGVVDYSFPNTVYSSTREAFGTATFSNIPLSPSISVYRDFDQANSWYVTAGVSQSMDLIKDKASAVLSFTSGWGDSNYNSYYFGVDDSKMNDGNVSLAIPYVASSSITITPSVQYTWLWDSTIRDAADSIYFDKQQFVGGLKATYTF